jgi:hypothetical protein
VTNPYGYGYSNDKGGRAAVFLAGAVAGAAVGALVVAMIWSVLWWLGSGDSGSDGPTADAPDAAALSESTPDGAATTRLDRCHEVYDAQDRALTAGASSLSQWAVHVGAMNKLVRGEITLDQAWDFWNQTRVGAARELERVDAASGQFRQRTARCPQPRGSAVDPDLRTCAEAVAARYRTIRLSAVALETWRMHVHHMEMLRDGEMSAQEATRLWLQNWRQGNREIMAYREAAKTAEGLTC